jgi:hypothetical protein
MTSGINMGIPSDEYIRGFIEQGLYTPPSRVEPSVRTDDEEAEVDYRVNRIIAVIGPERYDRLSQEQRNILLEAIEEKRDLERAYNSLGLDQISVRPQVIFNDRGGDPPIVRGQTEPIDPITDNPISVPTPQEQVDRYREYFNQNQGLYEPFRNMFRDLLPVFTGALGGYFAFSLTRIRERNTIQQILNNERQLIDTLSFRINDLIDQYDNSIEDLNNLQVQENIQIREGYDILQEKK